MQPHEEGKGGELQQIAYGYNVEVKGISGGEIKQKKKTEKNVIRENVLCQHH